MIQKVVTAAMLAAAAGVTLAGCSSGSTATGSASAGATQPVVQNASSAASGYWTEERLRSAQDFRPDGWQEPSAGAPPTARENAKTLRVGALFYKDSSGGHFCTGSVVDSSGGNVIETAAHCLNEGKGGADKSDIVFVPAYANGQTPYGEWEPAKYVMDSRWVNGADPGLDVAFVLLKQHQGKHIEQVLGGNTIAFNSGYQHKVRVTGYPASADAPITCDNSTTKQDPDYLRFPCANFYGGTSGSPFLTNYNAQTRTGTIVGVLGGYEEGGSTPDVSYSDNLGDAIKKLYDEAVATKA